MNKSMMKSKCFAFLAFLLVASQSLTSCLKDDDDTVYYEDTALTSFSLSTLNRYVTTTSTSGRDSVYVQKVSCSGYHFYIDQLQGLIYNTDSLPHGLDLTKVVCTMTSKNSGVVIINKGSAGKDSLVYYSQTDSIDMSKPLEVRVYNMKMTNYRTYKLTVNMHTEDGDEFRWTRMADNHAVVSQAQAIRVLGVGPKAYALALAADGTTSMLDLTAGCTPVADPIEGLSMENAVTSGSAMYALQREKRQMQVVGVDAQGAVTRTSYGPCAIEGVERLVGASTGEIYALGKGGGLLVSVDNGLTWKAESLDSDASLLPQDNISCSMRKLRTNDDVVRVTLVGTRPDRESAVVWMKIVDPEAPHEGQWMLVADGSAVRLSLPWQSGLTVVPYGDADVAYGMTAAGEFAAVRESLDGGVTWTQESSLPYPADAQGNGVMGVGVDANNFVWMALGGSGQVWRGRLTKLGWADVQKVFTE